MPEMKGKVSPGWARPVQLSTGKSAKKSSKKSCEISAKPSNQSSVGGLAAAQREVMVLRVRRFSLWALLGLSAAAPLAPACGQNLDAGKPASQIFAEVCANCHRSPREFKSNPGTSFLREHYTTGSDMASTMSAYLSGAGNDSRTPGAPQPKRQPAANQATTTAPPGADTSRDPRRALQAADPKNADPKNADPKNPDPKNPDPKALAATRGKPGSVRTEGTAEAKPPSPPAPTRPVLEDFEE